MYNFGLRRPHGISTPDPSAAHDIPPPSVVLAVLYLPASGHTKICFKWHYECKIKEPTLNVLEIVKICFKKFICGRDCLLPDHSLFSPPSSASLAGAQIKKHLSSVSNTNEEQRTRPALSLLLNDRSAYLSACWTSLPRYSPAPQTKAIQKFYLHRFLSSVSHLS